MTKEKENLQDSVVREEEMPLQVNNLNNVMNIGKSKVNCFTTLEDTKKIFNLENSCDYKINDCKGEMIRVKDVLIKVIERELEEPNVNEETGEIQDKEFKKVCILIDEAGKSYVTASKMFTNRMLRYLDMFGVESIKNGLDIKVTEVSVKGSSNKALSFEVV